MVDDTTDSMGFLGVFTSPTAGEELLNGVHSGVHGRSVTGLAIPLINGAKHQFLMRVDTFAQLFIIRAIESLNVNAQGGRFAVLSGGGSGRLNHLQGGNAQVSLTLLQLRNTLSGM